LPYHTGVLEDAPTGPDMVFMPGGGRLGREDRGSALFPSPAGNLVKGDPVGTAGEVQRGDRDDRVDAEELFKGVYPKLAGWVRRLVDDDDTAHEIASEAFVRLLARWTKVDSPQSYLYMIATNLIRDHWRKTERERRAMRSVTASAALDPVAYPVQDVDVRNLIASLPPRLRDPFLLHYYGGFGIREVAALLHRPEGTIKADLFAARAKLKTALGEHDG
jgi:RNA polymerase sigma-70 factor (ECF subfamily)